ncbi:MAG: hypothetical protein OEV20_09815 [Actinomycetota bacterium]|nr:hypothetical protein [Actinomycetota bacterium]
MTRLRSIASARAAIVLAAAALLSPVDTARAADEDDARLEALEERIEELETERDAAREGSESRFGPGAWTRHVRIGGSANVGWYDGQSDGVVAGSGFQVRDARFFVDAELGQELALFGHTIVRNAGFSFEWDLVRIGMLSNRVGEAYAELQGIGGSEWLNFQLGRFQIPVGEAYLRYSRGRWKNAFISQPVGGTWFWDEGVKLYGRDVRGRFAYVASITENETAFNASVSSQKQYSLKLMTDPTPWLHLSASFLYGGDVGSATSPGSGGGLWLGETWARGIGVNTTLPVYQNGAAVADGPFKVDSSWYAGADAIFDFEDKASVWLAYGAWDIGSPDGAYDRMIHSWIAEVVVYGSLFSPRLDGVYLGARASGLGTYDDDRGYSYDVRTLAQTGYNGRSLEEYSAVLGWQPIELLVLRFEYTHRRATMVSGVPAAQLDYEDDLDAWGVEIGVHF